MTKVHCTSFTVCKAACKRTQQLPTLLRQQCWELLHACWQWYANGCNNSQQCWDLQCIVGRIQPISLCKPCVMSVRGPNNVGRPMQTDPTLLGPRTLITHGLQRPIGCILATMHRGLGVVACVCTQPKKVNDSNCPVQKLFLYRPIQNSFRKLLNSPQSITSTHGPSDFPICIIFIFVFALIEFRKQWSSLVI